MVGLVGYGKGRTFHARGSVRRQLIIGTPFGLPRVSSTRGEQRLFLQAERCARRESHLQKSPENASTPRLYLDGGDVEPGFVKPTQEPAVARKVFCSDGARGVQAVPVVQDHGRMREKRGHALRGSQGAEGDRDACTLLLLREGRRTWAR